MPTDPEYYTNLVTRYFTGELRGEALDELSGWLRESPGNLSFFRDQKRLWDAVRKLEVEQELDPEAEWSAIEGAFIKRELKELKKVNTNRVPWFIPRMPVSWLRVAAVFLLLLGGAFTAYWFLKPPKQKLLVAEAAKVEARLPDGSAVILNKGSSLVYPEVFRRKSRAVALDGEAYFNVKHDVKKPFIISAGKVTVEVLGTSFYVSTRSSNDNIEVILTSGSLAVYFSAQPEQRLIISPGEKALLDSSTGEITKSTESSLNYMAFATGKLVFVDNSLAEIASILSKVYHVPVLVADPLHGRCRLTATFENQSLESILKVISASLGTQVSQTSRGTELRGTPCNP